MHLQPRSNISDRCLWQCPTCHKCASIGDESFFERSQLPLQNGYYSCTGGNSIAMKTDRLITTLKYCLCEKLMSSTVMKRMLERLVTWKKTSYKQKFSTTMEQAIIDKCEEDRRRHQMVRVLFFCEPLQHYTTTLCPNMNKLSPAIVKNWKLVKILIRYQLTLE